MENSLGNQRQVGEEPKQSSLELEKLPEAAKRLIQELRENQAVLERQNQQLRRSEFYYQALVEHQLQLVCRTSPEGNLTFVNEAYCRYFGKSQEELLGSNFLDLIPSEEQFPILCRRVDFTPSNPTLVAEHHVLDAQGRLRWNRWTTQAFFGADGDLVEFQSVGWDITEQKKATEWLWLLETVVPQLNEAVMITDAAMITDPPFRIVYVNPAFTRMTGYSSEEVIGQTPRLLQGPATDQSILEGIRQVLAQGQPAQAELINYRKDGTPFWIEFSISPVINQTGLCTYFIAVQRDITRRKRAEQELQRHRDHLDELVKERTAELAEINEQLRQEIRERLRAEEALRRGEEHYALAQQAAQVGSWERDLFTGKVYWPEQTEAIFGFAPGEFPGTYEAFLACIHPEDRQAVVEAAQNSLFRGRDYNFEHRIIRRDGTVRWVLERGNAVRDEQGRPVRFTGIVQDITEYKQADKALQEAHEQERYLRQVADSLREVVTILNSSLALEEVLAQIFAQSSRVIRYEGGAIFWPEGEDLLLSQAVGSVAQGHRGERIPIGDSNPVARVFRNKQPLVINEGSQEPHWMDWPHKQLIYAWVGMPLKVDQEIIGVLTLDRYQPDDPFLSEDVQILQAFANQAALAIRNARLYEALQASELRFRAITELISDYAYSIRVEPDQTLTLEWYTSAFTQITGHTFEDIKGPLHKLIVYPEDMPLVQQYLQKLLANQEEVIEYRIVTTTGDIRWVRDYGRPVWDEAENRVVRFINAAQDITERKYLEEQLYHAQKMDALGRLAGGVAHHFNNLLTAIIGFIELGLINLPPYHPAAEDLNQAHTTSLRAATLTHQLIAFTRRQMVHPKLFNLNDLVKRGETLLARLIPVSVTLTTYLAPQTGLIKIDESQFEQLLANLVINACEAMAEGGHLTIKTANIAVGLAEGVTLGSLSPGPYVRLTISDTGIGISDDVQARIFEPFFTTKDVGQGAGLGLSTCYGIVKQHGGEITVESRSGQGATFHIYFPQVEGEG